MPQDVTTDSAREGPKYKRIYLDLRDSLANGVYTPGSKLPSENDLVARFQASRPTVRRALAQLESEGFVERRMGSGTVVSQRGQRKSHVFGLLIPELGSTEIFEPICMGIAQARAGGQHDLLWGPSFSSGTSKATQAERLCQYFIERSVSGIFFAPIEHFAGGDAVNVTIARTLEEAAIPIVLLDRDIVHFPARSKFDLVGIDNHRAGFVLAEHLLLGGSRRVAFFAEPDSAHTVDARFGGYREALQVHLGPSAQPLVKWAEPGDVPTVQAFLKQAKPDAILCANDYTAAQLLRTLSSIGIEVPAQIRIAGIDDVKYARLLQTPLTTIRQPCLEIGATAMLAMLDRIAHPESPSREFLVDFQLIVRKSTSPDAFTDPGMVSSQPESLVNSAGAQPARLSEIPTSPSSGQPRIRTDQV